MSFHVFAIGRLLGPGFETRCVLGRGGVIAARAKREGDGATPAGVWPLLGVRFRPDRESVPVTQLGCAPIAPDDGWCDAPADPNYNRPVRLPYSASAETLWREDHVYDLIVVLGYNTDPVTPGAGSAIFLHLAQPDWRATEGCVAIARDDMLKLLSIAEPGDTLTIMD